MKKGTIFLLGSTMLLLGTVIGFLLSPIKKGFYIGNNSGNSNCGEKGSNDEDWNLEVDDEDDMPF